MLTKHLYISSVSRKKRIFIIFSLVRFGNSIATSVYLSSNGFMLRIVKSVHLVRGVISLTSRVSLNWSAAVFRRRHEARKRIMRPGISIDQMNGEIAWKGKQDRRSAGNSRRQPLLRKLLSAWLFATLRSGGREGGREGGRASPFAEEKRNENVFPDVYRQIENPGRRLCQVRTESGEWPVNGEIGEITWAAGKSTKTRSSRSERM